MNDASRASVEPNSSPLGVILAGGASRRLGRDKASLVLPGSFFERLAALDGEWRSTCATARSTQNGVTTLEWTAHRLNAVCDECVIAGSAGTSHDERWQRVADAVGQGPVAGLLGAAREFPDRSLLVMAVDLPLVRVRTLRSLLLRWQQILEGGRDRDAVVAWGVDRWHPLLGIYGTQAIDRLAKAAERGSFALYRTLRAGELDVERFVIDRPSNPATDTPAQVPYELTNLNTEDDWRRLPGIAG